MPEKRVTYRFLNWFASPWVGLIGTIGTIIGIIGLVFTLYAYSTARRFKELTYYVSPVRTVVLKSGETSGLQVVFRGQAISTDVTGVQVTIWNQGTDPVHRGDVLRQVRIRTNPSAQILEATIRKSSRPETAFSVDTSRRTEGFVPVSWTILEKDDGAIIQLIYAGPTTTTISLDGTLIGQKRISPVEFPQKILSPTEQLARMERDTRISTIAMIVLAFIFIAGLTLLWWARRKASRVLVTVTFSMLFAVAANLVVYFLQVWRSLPGPPISLDK